MEDDTSFIAISKVEPKLPNSLRDILIQEQGDLNVVRKAITGCSGNMNINDVTLLPVIHDASVIWAIGVNYKAHRLEAGSNEQPYPMLFIRIAAAQVGHNEPMIVPKVSNKLDYEGELAVIIGKGGRHIPEEKAFEHVAGYSCYNDGSVRDWQRHNIQFSPGKNFEATGGFGPWMMTSDEFGDPYRQTLSTRVNGEQVQHTEISLMEHKIERIINYLSTIYTLQPGDVISTGTPGGVGYKRQPPLFLKEGDRVEVEVSNLGTLINPVKQEQ